MTEARVIRTIQFTAVHHYRRADRSDAENRRTFGAQVEPHEHDWTAEVHVVGPVDPVTGWAVDLEVLDRVIADVTAGWDGGDLNALLPPVRTGAATPSTENVARWLFEALRDRIEAPARLVEVRVFESPELGSAYPAYDRSPPLDDRPPR